MKKIILGLIFTALLAGSTFAKSNFNKRENKSVYLIYKVQIRNDVNREFYSKALMCQDLVNEPHTSGDASEYTKGKALFNTASIADLQFQMSLATSSKKTHSVLKSADLVTYYYKGNPVGDFTYTQIYTEDGTSSDVDGLVLQLFGSRFPIVLPLAEELITDENHKTSYNKVSFDADAKYVYAGTFVYDFIDGTVNPKLVEVVDEYDAAKEWVNQMAGEEVQLCRAVIE